MQVVTTTATLANVLLELNGAPDAPFRLKQALSLVDEYYDYALIDCPPSLGHATTNALTAAHVALVPLQCEFLSLRGLTDVQEIASAILGSTNPNLRLRVVATMFDKRTIHAQDVLIEARNALPGLVYETVIPRTVRLAEAPATGQTIFEYAPESNGAFAYQALAQEVIREDSGYGTTELNSGGDTRSAVATYGY
jgi:chromosome partitioning protein